MLLGTAPGDDHQHFLVSISKPSRNSGEELYKEDVQWEKSFYSWTLRLENNPTMSFCLVLICVAVFAQQCTVHSASLSLPSNFKKCKKSDPNLNSCLQTAVVDAIHKMKDDGLSSLGIFPLDPLQVDEMHISSGSKSSPINLNIHFRNMQIKGISRMDISRYGANIKDAKLHTVSTSPEIVIESDYVADGKVLLLPVTGKGKCTFVFNDLKTTSDLVFKPKEKNGQTYWNIQDYKVKFEPKKMRVHFGGLLNGDKGLNDGINEVLNQNWQLFLDELRPQFESSMGEIFKEITNRVFSRVPIDNIFD